MNQYLGIAILFVIAIGVALIAIVLGELFGPRHPTPSKAIPYESDIRPIGPGARRMSVRFYLIAVLFILFDIEVIFFLPWAVVFKSIKVVAFVEMTIFIIILLVGLIYVWKKGALEWE